MTTQQAQTTGDKTSIPVIHGTLLMAKILPGKMDATRAALAGAAEQMFSPKGGLQNLAKVHFARMAIVGDSFLFASYYDGDLEDYLDDFFSFKQGETFDEGGFRFLEGWPGPHDREGFKTWWKSHQIDEVLYSYYPGATCKEIEKALRIRNNLEAVLEDFE